MRTRTLFISFSKLAKCDYAEVVVTLALICNDLAIANSSMSRYSEVNSPLLAHVRRGARIYFSRMMSGHLNEALGAVQAVRDTPQLMMIVTQCSEAAQAAFNKLCDCLTGGPEQKKFEKYVGWVRNRVAFHYDPNDIRWAIDDRAGRAQADTSSLTGGGDIHSTRFEFGDDLLDSIVVRRLWKIPRSKDVKTEADRVATWCDEMCRRFLEFSQEFIPCFLRGRATT